VFRAELIKLKRSSTWLIALILPSLAVVTGTINLANNKDALDSGWASFTSQVVLFYGLLFYSMGISLLAATVWRMEHRGTNWNLLLTTTAQPPCILGLDGPFPWQFAVVGLLALIAAIPLTAAQSLLSMLLRSFAAPVALCLLGCVIGIAAVTSTALRPVGYVLPQAINTRALNLGSTAISQSGGLTVTDVAPLPMILIRIVKLR